MLSPMIDSAVTATKRRRPPLTRSPRLAAFDDFLERKRRDVEVRDYAAATVLPY